MDDGAPVSVSKDSWGPDHKHEDGRVWDIILWAGETTCYSCISAAS